jgi:hypothetical protein
MASDYPFSITSKFIGAEGAEHLVTVRAPTIDQFRQNLTAAATVFPYAGFVATGDPQAPPADPQAPVSIAQARREVEVAEQVQGATANARAARANGHQCPDHARSAKSRYTGGLYCPTQLDDGSWCKWTASAPAEASGS